MTPTIPRFHSGSSWKQTGEETGPDGVSEPLVSVIMAARNNERFVADATASVLTQDYERLELLAVDDASEDATADVLEQCMAEAPPGRMLLVRHDRQSGIAKTRAHAFRRARGELIGLLDSDDLWLPGKLRPQVELMVEHADVGLAHAEFETFDSETRPGRLSHGDPGAGTATPTRCSSSSASGASS